MMYEAKGERASHIYLLRARVSNGELLDMGDDDEPPATEASQADADG